MSKTRPAALALTVLVAAFGLTACGQDRWCEHDATDTKVSDSYCKKGTPGYEWETDGHTSKTKHKTTRHTKTKHTTTKHTTTKQTKTKSHR